MARTAPDQPPGEKEAAHCCAAPSALAEAEVSEGLAEIPAHLQGEEMAER